METHGTSIEQLQSNQLAGGSDIVQEIMQDYENSTNPQHENMVPTYDPVVEPYEEEVGIEEQYNNYNNSSYYPFPPIVLSTVWWCTTIPRKAICFL